MLSDKTDDTRGSTTASSSEIMKAKSSTRRITFEVDSKKHAKLKMAAIHEECHVKEILNEAVDDWMKKHEY